MCVYVCVYTWVTALLCSPQQFAYMDDILAYIATLNISAVQFKYSTLSQYAADVKASGVAFPTVTGSDFYPYIPCSPCGAPECEVVYPYCVISVGVSRCFD